MATYDAVDFSQAGTILGATPVYLAQVRRKRGLGMRACATEVGVSHHTIDRCERGEVVGGPNLQMILFWLGRQAASWPE